MNNKLKSTLLAAVLTVSGIGAAQAEDDWEYDIAPFYIWAVGLEGESQIGPVTAPISLEFEDVLDNLEGIFTVHFEGRKGQHGFLFDITHVKLDPETVTPEGVPVGVDLTNQIIELGGIYQPQSGGPLEVLYGLRWSNFELDGTFGPVPTTTLVDENWWDAFVGLRGLAQVSDNIDFTYRGDIGAGDSDLTWSAALLFHWSFADNWTAIGGYKWLDYDFKTGSGPDRFTYDIRYEGPALGVSYSW